MTANTNLHKDIRQARLSELGRTTPADPLEAALEEAVDNFIADIAELELDGMLFEVLHNHIDPNELLDDHITAALAVWQLPALKGDAWLDAVNAAAAAYDATIITDRCSCPGCPNPQDRRPVTVVKYCLECGAARFVPNHPGCRHTA